ncbi:MAG: hypothetical protein ACRD2N_14405 [Vicinamibacterales bacterium]
MTDATIAACTTADNLAKFPAVEEDYAHLARQLFRRGILIDRLLDQALRFRVAIPSWALAAGGTRFAGFPLAGEPRTIVERLEDCAQINSLVRATNGVSLHFPWDLTDPLSDLQAAVDVSGLHIDSTNSNTFQDQPGQRHSYQFGTLTPDAAVRQQAIEHNIHCLSLADRLGARAHTQCGLAMAGRGAGMR